MPRNQSEGREDFEAEIEAISSDDSRSDESDGRESGSDLDELRAVLAVPGPDAQMHEVRKVGTLALVFNYVI